VALSGNQITSIGGWSGIRARGGFTAKTEADTSVEAPNYYAIWDVDIDITPTYLMEAEIAENYAIEINVSPNYEIKLDG